MVYPTSGAGRAGRVSLAGGQFFQFVDKLHHRVVVFFHGDP
jgi:hypothetical protein